MQQFCSIRFLDYVLADAFFFSFFMALNRLLQVGKTESEWFKLNQTEWFLYFLCYIAKVLYSYFFEIVVFYNDTDVIPIEFYTVVVFWEIIYMFLYVYNYMFFNLDVLAKDLSVFFFSFLF